MIMEYKPPQNISERTRNKKTVFLAGSIEMGQSTDWQIEVSKVFQKNSWNVLNPRRDNWDSSWEQKFENPYFYQQVMWELNALENADLIVMYFCPNTKSPISLLELGLYAKSGKLMVVCPENFWRKGNVDIVCHKYNIPLFNKMSELFEEIGVYNILNF